MLFTALISLLLVVTCSAIALRFPAELDQPCDVYNNKTNHCDDNCGLCFNPGARPGKICQGPSTGYYCASDTPPAGADMAFACMDWTFGSMAMQQAEKSFHLRTGQDVYLGLGTYGTSADPQQGLGACFRLNVTTLDKDLIVQSINTGSDVAGNQFDLQMGDGGAGAFNTCAGDDNAMYAGGKDVWGHQYGGVDHRADCANLPVYPRESGPMKAAKDNLVSLCQYSFDKKVRGEGGSNPTLLDVSRVQCPPELIEFTQIARTDDPTTYDFHRELRAEGFPNDDPHQCKADTPGAGTAYCLTRMMDCRKPSGGFKDNIKANLVKAGMRVVQPCTRDGYTRIDVQCGCMECYC